MSRLRRPFLSDRYLFVTLCLLRSRLRLEEADFGRLARAVARMRQKHGFLLTAWVFLPDHWHAIICPTYPLTISRVVKAVKVSSMIAVNHWRGEGRELWQERFFDRAQRTVKTSEDGGLHPLKPGAARLGEAAGGVEMVERGRIRGCGWNGARAAVRAVGRSGATAGRREHEDLRPEQTGTKPGRRRYRGPWKAGPRYPCFEGFTGVSSGMGICFSYGVAGYCNMGTLSGWSLGGNDEFDINIPGSGVYWAAPPGSTVINQSGRTSTSTGTLGFSDQVSTWVRDTEDFPLINKLSTGQLDPVTFSAEHPQSPQEAYNQAWEAAMQQLGDITSGGYLYLANFTATGQSPNPVPFGLVRVYFKSLGVWVPQWTPLPGFGQ